MLIAQITDLHVVARGTLCYAAIDTNAMLADAVTHLNAFEPRVDVVLATGDLTDNGRSEEYEALAEILDALEVPIHLVPGNHDERDAFLQRFGGLGGLPNAGAKFAHYVVDDHAVRMIGVDTTTQGVDEGRICKERLAWLDTQLTAAPDRPTLVFMHHPPFETGIEWMDGDGLHGGRRLAELIARHPQVERVLCGHLHRSIQTRWAGTIASIAPGTAHQVDLALRGVRWATFVMEPPAVALHLWQPPLGIVSHISYVGTNLEPFRPDIELPAGYTWERVEANVKSRYRRMKESEYR
jgi:3',5'-cyclic AMP phosphodiesterase CpdA